MFERITPEQAGISSSAVAEYLRFLERANTVPHGLLLMKGNRIFSETYWQPYHRESCHRMYSQTKSFVGIAIGLLEEEGKLSLSDRIVDFFPDRIGGEVHPWLREQTIGEMLTMTTVGEHKWWFGESDPDRVHLYFDRERVTRPSGTTWEYDSAGSQVLCALVERLSGMPLLTYLKRKLFDRMGTFQTAQILKTPNGDSWGDSAMICTLRDIASFGRLLMQGGVWNGERLMNEAYIRKATSAVVSNRGTERDGALSYGYGYQIWKTEQNGFAFVGMGDQITICLPEKDLLFSIVSDNQGDRSKRQILMRAFFTMIADRMCGTELPEDPKAAAELNALGESLRLYAEQGEPTSPWASEIDGKTYLCDKNPLGMRDFTFAFSQEEQSGCFRYHNEQGEKSIPFGINRNVFGYFPEYGYSNDYGTEVTTNGFRYRDAASACWLQENRLRLYVQIIDRYLGNLTATFSFRGDRVFCEFAKNAEAFLDRYHGSFMAQREE